MSTITAILDPDPDGTLHLPLPAEWRSQKIRIKAEIEPVPPDRIRMEHLRANHTPAWLPKGFLDGPGLR